jgi:hypothetical protein
MFYNLSLIFLIFSSFNIGLSFGSYFATIGSFFFFGLDGGGIGVGKMVRAGMVNE